MMAGTRWWAPAIALLAGVLGPSAMLGGCTLLTTLDDLSGGADETPDSALPSTPPCSTCDGGVDGAGRGDTSPPVDGAPVDGAPIAVDAATDADSGPIPPGSFACGAGSVASCADCPGSPEPCLTCDNAGATSTPFCAAAGANCRDVAPAPYKNGCPCGGGVATCPGSFHTCHGGNFCHTCGEPLSSGDPCKTGGVCSGTTCM